MISAFGPRAEHYAAGLGDLEAVIFEPGLMGNAYIECVRRRERAEPFYALFLYDDPRCSLVNVAAPQILAATADHDQRLQTFRALASGDLPVDGKAARETWNAVPAEITVLAPEIFALADGMLVRSVAEYARLAPLYRRTRTMQPVLAEPKLPPFGVRRPTPSVVVWAPHRPAVSTAFEAFSLLEFPGPVTVVCADGETLSTVAPVRFMRAGDAGCADVLAAAGVVVCPDLGDPGAAVAFARAGFAVASPLTAGAVEWIAGLAAYDAASPRSLWEAVAVAFGQPPTEVRSVAPVPRSPSLPPLPAAGSALPLVTVVIPTYNRRDDVKSVLAGLQQQTYPNIEVVVVNDAGESVDDVVASFPFARVYNQPENGGAIRATMAGLREAHGDYIQFLADDDWLFPDHIQRLLAALLKSGAAAAHGNTLIRYQERAIDGAWRTVGFNAVVFTESTTPSEALVSTPIAGQAMLVRRDVFEQIGGWREDTFLADQEFQFRLWRHYPIVWVDNITAEWRVRGTDNFSGKVNSAPELQRIFDDFHPVEGRPILEAIRRSTIENVASRPPGYIFPATIRLTSSA